MSQVNHPSHYNSGKIEVIEYLEDQFMDRPHEWNAVKYLSRSNKKNPDKEIEDLEKSIWYINRKIELLRAAKDGRELKRPNDMNQRDTSVTNVLNSKQRGQTAGFATNAGSMILFGQWRVHSDQFVVFVPIPDNTMLLHLNEKKGAILFTPDEK